MDWKLSERIIFRLSMHASETSLTLLYEDDHYGRPLASAQFRNFVLTVEVETNAFEICTSLGEFFAPFVL